MSLERDDDDGHVVVVVPPRAARDLQQLARLHACNTTQRERIRQETRRLVVGFHAWSWMVGLLTGFPGGAVHELPDEVLRGVAVGLRGGERLHLVHHLLVGEELVQPVGG